jgi:hypothetical protein
MTGYISYWGINSLNKNILNIGTVELYHILSEHYGAVPVTFLYQVHYTPHSFTLRQFASMVYTSC